MTTMTTKPYKVQIVEGLTKSVLRGFNPRHSYNKLAGISYSEITGLMKYRPDGYKFMPKYQSGVWDGWVRLYYWQRDGTLSFPTGFTTKITKYCKKHGLKVEYTQSYTYRCPQKCVKRIGTKKLRKYQWNAANQALMHKRGIIKCPTASGKTTIAGAIIHTVKGQTLWLTNKTDLLYQTQKSLQTDLGITVGIVGDGKRDWKKVTVANIKTLVRHKKQFQSHLNDTKVLIGDEIHHATGDQWFKLMKTIPGIYRLGLSATPPTGEKFAKLEAVCGPIIVDIKSSSLIKNNYLSKPYIHLLTFHKKRMPQYIDYQGAVERGIVRNKIRNDLTVKVAVDLCKLPGLKPVVIQCRLMKHMRLIKKRLDKTNLVTVYLSGQDSGSKRQKLFKCIEHNKIDILVISSIFDEGVDVKNIRTLIIASGGSSPGNTIQKLGRGMRTLSDKNSVIVIDFMDECNAYLHTHSKRRLRTYKKEGHEVIVCDIDTLQNQLQTHIKQ